MTLSTTPSGRLGIDPDEVEHEYARGFGALTDEQLFDLAAGVISIPKQEPANSFVLHVPLELLARRTLLRYVQPDRRAAIRERMIWVAAKYERASEPIEPAADSSFDCPAAAVVALLDAAQHQDLDAVDGAASWLSRHASTHDVMALAEPMIDSLAAAGHASIYFFHLGRTAAHSRSTLGLLRPLAREVARLSQLRIEWLRNGIDTRDSDGSHLADGLADTPRLGLPGSDFIFPIVHQVDGDGPAPDIIDGSLPRDLAAGREAILRVATQSMLQDDPTYAPYGWSHCLTLPQAVLGITPWLSTPALAAAIAATYVVAFRAAESHRDVDNDWRPERVSVAPLEVLGADPQTASSAVFHASDEELNGIVPELAARAGSHEDAHLAKYTLACFDAAATDPAERRLYLSAAAYLGAWWASRAE